MTTKDHTPQTVFAKNVKSRILSSIKGSVKTYIIEDALIVKIYGVNDIVFISTIEHISNIIYQGYTSEFYAHVILQRYTKYIRNLFFL